MCNNCQNNNCCCNKNICNDIKLSSQDNSITITKNGCEWNFKVDPEFIDPINEHLTVLTYDEEAKSLCYTDENGDTQCHNLYQEFVYPESFCDDVNDCVTIPTYTANNGLNKSTSLNTQLGGPLIVPTTITTTNVNTLKLLGLVTNTAPSFILTEDNAGNITKSNDYTATNGLTKLLNNTKLGGTITEDTTIGINTKNLSFTQNNVAGNQINQMNFGRNSLNDELGHSVFLRDNVYNSVTLHFQDKEAFKFERSSFTDYLESSPSESNLGYLANGLISINNNNVLIGHKTPQKNFPGNISVSPDENITTSVRLSDGVIELYAKDVNFTNNISVTNKIKVVEGSDKSIGTTTLISGSKTILTSAINTNSKVFITRSKNGGTLGHLTVPKLSIVNGVSFTIVSSSNTETSDIDWLIIN